MIKKIALVGTLLSVVLLTGHANACMEHYMYDGFGHGNSGYFTGLNSAYGMKRPAAKDKVFKVKHPAAAVAVIDENTSLEVAYTLPPASKNVSLQFSATSKLEMLDRDIQLTDLDGTVTARFRATQKGVDIITVTVSGEHEGEVLKYTSTVYVNAKAAASS